MDESAELNMERGGSAGAAPPRKRGFLQSIRDNPHQFILVLIGAVTLYVTYRIWKSHQSGGSSGGLVPVAWQGQPNWGSVLGSSGSVTGTSDGGGGSSSGGNGFPFQLTLTPPLHESVYQNASNGGTARSWFTSAGQTVAQIAALFGIQPAGIEYNAHNAMYHYNDNSVIPQGVDVWIPQSGIDPTQYQIQYNSSLGGPPQGATAGPLGRRYPSDPLP